MGFNSSTVRNGICVSWDHAFFWDQIDVDEIDDDDDVDEIDDDDDDDDVDDVDDVLVEDGNPSWCTRLGKWYDHATWVFHPLCGGLIKYDMSKSLHQQGLLCM